MVASTINGQHQEPDIEPETPLLWVIRDELGLTGTKYGCAIVQWRLHRACRRPARGA